MNSGHATKAGDNQGMSSSVAQIGVSHASTSGMVHQVAPQRLGPQHQHLLSSRDHFQQTSASGLVLPLSPYDEFPEELLERPNGKSLRPTFSIYETNTSRNMHSALDAISQRHSLRSLESNGSAQSSLQNSLRSTVGSATSSMNSEYPAVQCSSQAAAGHASKVIECGMPLTAYDSQHLSLGVPYPRNPSGSWLRGNSHSAQLPSQKDPGPEHQQATVEQIAQRQQNAYHPVEDPNFSSGIARPHLNQRSLTPGMTAARARTTESVHLRQDMPPVAASDLNAWTKTLSNSRGSHGSGTTGSTPGDTFQADGEQDYSGLGTGTGTTSSDAGTYYRQRRDSLERMDRVRRSFPDWVMN